MSEQELLPCPFCGCVELFQPSILQTTGWVWCMKCRARGPTDRVEAAIAAWNRRATQSADLVAAHDRIGELQQERDAARDLACRLEQELAAARQELGLLKLALDVLTMPKAESERIERERVVSENLTALPPVRQLPFPVDPQ